MAFDAGGLRAAEGEERQRKQHREAQVAKPMTFRHWVLHTSITQAWPNLELTLKDTNGKPLVRRDFLPRDYLLDAQDVERGFASSTEQQIKLVFSVSQPDSSGYEVAIFYP